MRILRRLGFVFRASRAEADWKEEMDFHSAKLEQEFRDAGMSPEDARHAAMRRMGVVPAALEDSRGIWVAPWFENIFRDFVYSLRSLRRQPTFVAMVLVAIGLGIGLNTSLFTVVNAVAFQPWPVRDPGSMVGLTTTVMGPSSPVRSLSVPEYRYLRKYSHTLSGAILMDNERIRLDDQPDGPRTAAYFVSGNYFQVLGVPMALGRSFTETEDAPESGASVVVLSYRTWQKTYGSNPRIVGRQVRLDGAPFTVIGVANESFTGTSPGPHDLWAPLGSLAVLRPNDPAVTAMLTNANYVCTSTAARLAPGISQKSAEGELTLLMTQFRAARGEHPQKVFVAGATLFSDPDTAKFVPFVVLLVCAVGSILLLACANVSNLLLARTTSRQREIGVRLSLGAGRWRVVRQLMTESLVLGFLASGIGVALAYTTTVPLLRMAGVLPTLKSAPDVRVMLYAVALAVLSAILFGLAPALRATRVSLSELMKAQSGVASTRFRMRGVLLAAQVCISVALLTSAGVLTRGMQKARALDPGFRVQGVSLVAVDLPGDGYDAARSRVLFEQLAGNLKMRTGRSVGLTTVPPFSRVRTNIAITSGTDRLFALNQSITADYLSVLGIPLVAGRSFQAGDENRNVVLINEALAARLWPRERAVGHTLTAGTPKEVVGVVRNAALYGMSPREPILFEPFQGARGAYLVVPGTTDWTRTAVTTVAQLAPRAAVRVLTMSDQLEVWIGPAKMGAALAAGLGLLALILASLGVYGVISYTVEQRRREVGIRMALGANGRDVTGFILRSNASPVLIGLAIGVVIAILACTLLRGVFYGLNPIDPLALLEVLVLLSLAGIAASVIPAMRGARVDPAVSLRYE